MNKIFYSIIFIICFSCSDKEGMIDAELEMDINVVEDDSAIDTVNNSDDEDESSQNSYKILALGDSYTYGTSVCEACSFPAQLRRIVIRTRERSSNRVKDSGTQWLDYK